MLHCELSDLVTTFMATVSNKTAVSESFVHDSARSSIQTHAFLFPLQGYIHPYIHVHMMVTYIDEIEKTYCVKV